MQVLTKIVHIFMNQIRYQKTKKYKGNLNPKLLFLQNDENVLTICCIQPTNYVTQDTVDYYVSYNATLTSPRVRGEEE